MRTPCRAAKGGERCRVERRVVVHRQQDSVRAVTAAAAASRSTLRVAGSTSTKTARAPTRSITFALAKKLCAGVTTSSPGPTPEELEGDFHGPRGGGQGAHGRPPT